MVGIIIHLMCVKSLQLACNYLLSVGTGGSGHLQVNELLTSGLDHYDQLTHYQTKVLNP